MPVQKKEKVVQKPLPFVAKLKAFVNHLPDKQKNRIIWVLTLTFALIIGMKAVGSIRDLWLMFCS